jgi:predicted permease
MSRQVQEELAFHIESYAAEMEGRGMSREEALRRARIELGSVAARREDCRRAWGAQFFDELLGDLRYALRMLAKSPGFAAIAVASLALGIGANTVIFSMTKALLLDSMPVAHPEQLRLLEWQVQHQFDYRNLPMPSLYGEVDFSKTGVATGTSFSYAEFEALKQRQDVFQDLMAYYHAGSVVVNFDQEPEPGTVEYASGNFFTVLGVRAAAGRTILPSEDAGNATSPVVVLSDWLWRDRFGRSPDVVGKTIRINRVPLTIVGVARANFHGAGVDIDPMLYVPLNMQPVVAATRWDRISRLKDPAEWWVQVMGRIKPGITNARAQAALDGVFRETAKATLKNPERVDQEAFHLVVTAGGRADARMVDKQFLPMALGLSALSGLVLLLACLNLASLLLARAVGRQRELSVRLALGARRRRVMRQLLTESMTLALAGGAAGTALGFGGRKLIPHFLGDQNPQFDWKVYGFALALTLLTGLAFGAIPAWRATRGDMQARLQDGGRLTANTSRLLLSRGLVAVQICFSMILVVGTGLFARTVQNLLHVDLGFEPHHLLLFDVELPENQYKTAANRAAAFEQLEERLGALPGVVSATLSGEPLINGGSSTTNFDPAGQPVGNGQAWINVVGDRFFETIEIPLLAGRDFGPQDTEKSAKAAVVNEELARRFFAGRNPIGLTFNSPAIRIVGVVGNTKFASLRQDPPPTYYVSARQHGNWNQVTFELKTAGNPSSVANAARAVVHGFDSQLPVREVRTQEEQIDSSIREERLFATLTAGFGVLASIGIYGVLAYSVSRRTSEIGIRMALGAQRASVLGMVLREAAWIAAIGVIAGMCGAVGMGRLVASMLFGLKSWDPATLGGSAALLALVVLGASWIPARRAAGVDPMTALRHE